MSKLDLAVLDALHLASQIIGTRTVFVSKYKQDRFQIFKMLNNNGVKLIEGQTLHYEETICKNVRFEDHLKTVVIHNTMEDQRTRNLFVTKEYEIGCCLAVPIVLKENQMYGTLCAADKQPYAFEQREIEEMERIARLLGYIVGASQLKTMEEEERIRLKNLSVMRELVADLADRIGNPLQVIKGFLQLDMSESGQHHPILMNEVKKIETKLSEILLHTNPTYPIKRETNIAHLLTEIIQTIEEELDSKVKIEVMVQSTIPKVVIDKDQIGFVLKNVIQNAVEALEQGEGFIKVTCRVISNDIIIEVDDDGRGITLANIEKVSQPFYTSKKEANGLGLTMTKQIVKAHQGEMMIECHENGTNVAIKLPIIVD